LHSRQKRVGMKVRGALLSMESVIESLSTIGGFGFSASSGTAPAKVSATARTDGLVQPMRGLIQQAAVTPCKPRSLRQTLSLCRASNAGNTEGRSDKINRIQQ
jgi:phage tail tape-measure protein